MKKPKTAAGLYRLSQAQKLIDVGAGSTATFTVNIPSTGSDDYQSLAQNFSRVGFWDSSGVFHPASRIISITPQ